MSFYDWFMDTTVPLNNKLLEIIHGQDFPCEQKIRDHIIGHLKKEGASYYDIVEFDEVFKLYSHALAKKNKVLIKWCKEMYLPRKTPLSGHTAYGMKHTFNSDTGIYVTQEEFTAAMIICGHEPYRNIEGVENFRISKRSLFFDWRARRCVGRGWYMNPELVKIFYEECGKRK